MVAVVQALNVEPFVYWRYNEIEREGEWMYNLNNTKLEKECMDGILRCLSDTPLCAEKISSSGFTGHRSGHVELLQIHGTVMHLKQLKKQSS